MAIQVTKDGRTILTGKDYDELKRQQWVAQNGKCADCPRILPTPYHAHLHHKRGRGAGKRDDTLEATTLVCWRCHDERDWRKLKSGKQEAAS